MTTKILESELLQFILKIIFPAFIGVGMKIAIEMKKDSTKVSIFNVCLSMFVGVGGAYLSSGFVQGEIPLQYQSIAIAFVAIISDKIAEFVIYKFNVDIFLTAFFDGLFSWISNMFKTNK